MLWGHSALRWTVFRRDDRTQKFDG